MRRLSRPESFFESFFNPSPLTAPISVCVDFAGTLRHPLSPFVLSLSK
ncbi:MAG: hypothetical protein LBD67_06665 [Candidatus Accumulibacter sp.]|nr:hypothetical protein [Accumulibacter sp.]